MYRITIDTDKVMARLQKFSSVELGGRMQAAMNESLAYLQTEVQKRTHVGASGLLRQSIFTQLRGTPINLRGEVDSSSSYKVWAERGRAPGKFPPRGPIELWAARVLGDARLWFVVARGIARHGTKGAWMFRDAFRAGSGRVRNIFRKHLMRR